VTLIQNQLVYIAPAHFSPQPAGLPSPESFLSMVGKKRLAIADPALAPSGQYSVRFLEKLGVWEQIQNQVAYSINVRQALIFVDRGAMTGFVYKSDAHQNPRVQIVFDVPIEMSGSIHYAMAPITDGNPNAQSFLNYLQSEPAQATWRNAGFHLLAPK
jgi:molybdate transport system substrate-binding protein